MKDRELIRNAEVAVSLLADAIEHEDQSLFDDAWLDISRVLTDYLARFSNIEELDKEYLNWILKCGKSGLDALLKKLSIDPFTGTFGCLLVAISDAVSAKKAVSSSWPDCL